jgi:hypothetical protein
MSKKDHKIPTSSADSIDDIKSAIKKLRRRDRVGDAGQILTTAGGATAGATAAGAVASAAGASTLLGSTTLASALGGVFVTSTPMGWVVGCAVAGAAAAYGVSRLVRSGGRHDRIREELIERLSKRLAQIKAYDTQPSAMDDLRKGMSHAIRLGHISEEQATRMVDLVEQGKLDIQLALVRINAFLSGG